MNKERMLIKPKAIVVFDKIVKASELNALTQGFDGDVIITKKLVIDQDLNVKCNLHVMGKVVGKYPISEFDIKINGDLYCYGEISCDNIKVSGYFYAEKAIYCKDLKVGENFVCNAKVDAFGCDIIIVENFYCKGVIAKKIRVIGQMSVYGSISASESIKIGY